MYTYSFLGLAKTPTKNSLSVSEDTAQLFSKLVVVVVARTLASVLPSKPIYLGASKPAFLDAQIGPSLIRTYAFVVFRTPSALS